MQKRLFGKESSVERRQPIVHGTQCNGKVEWYTPSEYIEAARLVMGSIDVDPATSEFAQRTVRASRYYTIDDDGLDPLNEWRGNVWLNPPYAASLISRFVDRLIGCIGMGKVSQCIMLTHNNTDTAWFHKAVNNCQRLCFTRGRVRFYDTKGTANSPTHGHTFFYFGNGSKKFTSVFRQFGFILRSVGAK